MNPTLDLDLPEGSGLPPPPPMQQEAFVRFWRARITDFYASPHYEAWLERTAKEMRKAKPFIME